MIELVDYALEHGLDPKELKMRIYDSGVTEDDLVAYVHDLNLCVDESSAIYEELAYVFDIYDEVH